MDYEDMRQELQAAVNTGRIQPEGQTWTTEQLQQDFDVIGFMAPYVVVRRKSDQQTGSLMFRHYPRVYFGWKADGGE